MFDFKLENTKDKIGLLFDMFDKGAKINSFVKLKATKFLNVQIQKSDIGCTTITFAEPKPKAILSVPILKDPEATIKRILVYKDHIEIDMESYPDIQIDVVS